MVPVEAPVNADPSRDPSCFIEGLLAKISAILMFSHARAEHAQLANEISNCVESLGSLRVDAVVLAIERCIDFCGFYFVGFVSIASRCCMVHQARDEA